MHQYVKHEHEYCGMSLYLIISHCHHYCQDDYYYYYYTDDNIYMLLLSFWFRIQREVV